MRVQVSGVSIETPTTVVVTVRDPDLLCGHFWFRLLRPIVDEHFTPPWVVEVEVVEAKNLLWLGRIIRIASEPTLFD